MNSQIKTLVAAQVGPTFSAAVFAKAKAKYTRWMKAAYGDIDWSEKDAEGHAGSILCYYRETEKVADGRATMNRQTFAQGVQS